MFKSSLIGFVCAAMVAFTASDANAFHGRHHRGNACCCGAYTYAAPVQSYYRVPTYGYGGYGQGGYGYSGYGQGGYGYRGYGQGGYGYGRSSYYRPSGSVGFGGWPYYGTGSGGYGYGYGGYPSYGLGRSGVTIGLGGLGRGW